MLKKKIFGWLTAACSAAAICLSLPATPAEAAADLSQCGFVQEQAILSSSEAAELQELVQGTASEIDMNVFVCLGTGQTNSESHAREYAKDYYFQQFDKDSDGIVLYLDVYGTYSGDGSYAPHDYIYTRGEAQLYYSNAEDYDRIHTIFSQMNTVMQRGNEQPYEAVEIFCANLMHYYDIGYPDEDYYVYDDEYDQYLYRDEYGVVGWHDDIPASVKAANYVMAFTIGFPIGLIVALITLFGTKHAYKFKTALTATEYVDRKQINFKVKNDRFVRVYQTKRKIESSSGGGGGGVGSSSGGGGGGGNSR